MKSYSQCKQDIFLTEHIFLNKNDGFFVEIGANDGITFSNTKVFEERGWNGICVEPLPEVFDKLEKNRTCKCVQGAISDKDTKFVNFNHVVGDSEMLSGIEEDYDNRHRERIKLECKMFNCTTEIICVPNYKFSEIVENKNIDLLCIDTEGNEFKILKTIDFDYYDIRVIVVENNYNDAQLVKFLEEKGYKMIKVLEGDQIFIK